MARRPRRGLRQAAGGQGARSKKLQLTIQGIRASDDESSSAFSDLSLYVGTIDWAIDCTGYQKPDSHLGDVQPAAVLGHVMRSEALPQILGLLAAGFIGIPGRAGSSN